MTRPLRRAACPGSFDPVTLGHLDIFTRAATLFDEVVVAVGINPSKSQLFTPDERMAMLGEVCSSLPNVRVAGFSGLIVDYCRDEGIGSIVKGLRTSSDFDYELPMAHMNTAMTGVETVFLATDPTLSYISSSLVKVVASNGGPFEQFVPEVVAAAVAARVG